MLKKSVLFRIYFIAVIGIIGFSVFWTYSFFTNANNSTRLSELESVHFPILERVDAIVVRTNKIKDMFTQSVIAGEEELLETAETEYNRNLEIYQEVIKINRTYEVKVKELEMLLSSYFREAKQTSMEMMAGSIQDSDMERKIASMNLKLVNYEKQQNNFRKRTYEAFTGAIKEANDAAETAINVGIVMGIISFSILGLGCFFIGKSIINPIKKMMLFISELKQGIFDKRLNLHLTDELGNMAQSMDDFADNLESAISEINEVMSVVAQGDFTRQVTGQQSGQLNELKGSINRSIELLSDTIRQAVLASDSVKTGSADLSASSNTLSNGTSKQASSLEEISVSMNEINSKTQANDESANHAEKLTRQTLDVVNNGNNQMAEMLVSMNKINETSSNVSKVIKVIDEIAFQTNLLALNAAVEAARAGKYGKGFSVVAEEVRRLAARSAEAAKDTTSLITESISEVENGVKNADLTAELLKEITTSMETINSMIGDIAKASADQSASIKEINLGLEQVNNVVMQSSAIAEETASTSQELSQQSDDLGMLMKRFLMNTDINANTDSETYEEKDPTRLQIPFNA